MFCMKQFWRCTEFLWLLPWITYCNVRIIGDIGNKLLQLYIKQNLIRLQVSSCWWRKNTIAKVDYTQSMQSAALIVIKWKRNDIEWSKVSSMLKAINRRINEGNVARLSLVANEWLCLVLSKAHCKLLLMVNNLCLMSGLIVVDVKQTIKCIAVLDFALSSSTFCWVLALTSAIYERLLGIKICESSCLIDTWQQPLWLKVTP